MRCPECQAVNESAAVACQHCGLLLTALPRPKRRQEDLATRHRRGSDNSEVKPCPFCGREIASDAVRCSHCADIVDPEYRRIRAARRRSHVNHASWMAYLFGLVAFVVFRPVGIVAIGAGLLLSILYYALPSGEDSQERVAQRPLARLRHLFAQVFRSERVSISLPHLPSFKVVLVGTPLVAAFIGLLANYFFLQQPMNAVLHENSSFRGMKVSAHYLYWMIPGVVVYDLENVDPAQSRLDVHTAFLEFARRMKGRHYREIELSFRGHRKFSISGDIFHRLGEAYEQHDYAFVLFDFPRMLSKGQALPDGHQALVRFHDQWYATDVMKDPLGAPAAADHSLPAPAAGRARS
jgi:predicted nucleic acid-binding Zn ribbon protein